MQRLPSTGRNLRLNSLAVVASNVGTGLLGLAFWAVAAKLFSPSQVGVASAMIASAIMLSTLSNLSLGAMYERFLPVAGHRAGSLLVRGYLLVACAALVLALGVVLFGPGALFPTQWEKLFYPPFVVVLAVFALQDNTVAGMGVARWGAAKNGFHAVAKLASSVRVVHLGCRTGDRDVLGCDRGDRDVLRDDRDATADPNRRALFVDAGSSSAQ